MGFNILWLHLIMILLLLSSRSAAELLSAEAKGLFLQALITIAMFLFDNATHMFFAFQMARWSWVLIMGEEIVALVSVVTLVVFPVKATGGSPRMVALLMCSIGSSLGVVSITAVLHIRYLYLYHIRLYVLFLLCP